MWAVLRPVRPNVLCDFLCKVARFEPGRTAKILWKSQKCTPAAYGNVPPLERPGQLQIRGQEEEEKERQIWRPRCQQQWRVPVSLTESESFTAIFPFIDVPSVLVARTEQGRASKVLRAGQTWETCAQHQGTALATMINLGLSLSHLTIDPF